MKRIINICLLLAGIAFVNHFLPQVMNTVDHMQTTAKSIGKQG